MKKLDNYATNCYKVTLNHVSLSSLGKVFDYWMHNNLYDQLVCGYEKGAKQGTPHFQVYIQNTDIDNHEDMRKLLCYDLYDVGVIDEKMTCVAFPLDDPSLSTSHYVVNYAQKDGHYIKHIPAEGIVECRWNNVRATWYDECWSATVFDHFRENCLCYPRFIDHVKTWGQEVYPNFYIDPIDKDGNSGYNRIRVPKNPVSDE